MAAPLPRSLPSFAPRPALASRPALIVVVLGLAGFLVDLLVRPVSTEGFLLILLAASPFLLELARSGRPAEAPDGEVEAAPRAAAPQPEAPAASRPPERPRPAAPRPVAARPAPPPAERQPATPRAPHHPEQARPAVQRPVVREEPAVRTHPREPAKLL